MGGKMREEKRGESVFCRCVLYFVGFVMLMRDQGEKKRKEEKSGRKERKRNVGTAGGTSDVG